jgi:acyl transferase domain-containing protein
VFDNEFFGIGKHEAQAMDPQQRLLLEVVYEAFENAGQRLEDLKGTKTAVYCSVSTCDYDIIQSREPECMPKLVDSFLQHLRTKWSFQQLTSSYSYRFTGTGRAMVSNRISHCFDLRGPSVTLDTACSSGLVLLHEACKTIRAGEADMGVVGGANLILDPDTSIMMSQMKYVFALHANSIFILLFMLILNHSVLSPDGRCYAFDQRANGFGRGYVCVFDKAPQALISCHFK